MIQQSQVALFKISKFYNIVGIGLVLTGTILEGEIDTGNKFQFESEDITANYRVEAVEQIDYPLRNEVETALIIEPIQPDLMFDFGSFIEQIIAIFKV